MIIFWILEVAFLPFYLAYVSVLHKSGKLTENRFGLLAVIYVGAMIYSVFWALSTTIELRIIGDILAFLCWFPGYLIAKLIYRRIFL